MGLFGKKKEEEAEAEEEAPAEEEKPAEEPAAPSGNSAADMVKMSANLSKLQAQFGTFFEVNKAATERFTRINEQIGELRTMILSREKASQLLEAKATQAIDLVQSVQPDKLMVELRKGDAKIEGLRANIESNDSVLKNAINEMKGMRNKLQVFTGVEQVMKLSEDVKGELIEIRKLSATIERHGDKVETIFSEMQKRWTEFERFSSSLTDLDKSVKQAGGDLDNIKTKISSFATKKEVEDLVTKFNNFEKQVSGLISLINSKFESFEKDFNASYKTKMEKTETLLKGFQELAAKTPDLDKYFNLLTEEAKKAASKDEAKPEKVKVPGQEEKLAVPEKEGIMGKISGLKDKLPAIGGKK